MGAGAERGSVKKMGPTLITSRVAYICSHEGTYCTIGEPEDSTSDLRYISRQRNVHKPIARSKKPKIEADFYDEGPRVFEFDVRGLDW